MRLSLIACFSLVFLFLACNNSAPERPEPMLDPNYEPTPPATTTTINNTNASSGVFHYKCPNGCGGGDAAGTCPVCGTAYVHNQAFHNQAPTSNTTNPVANANVTTSGTQAQTPEPAQNAAGVWHYTCPNGCDGGAGSALACAQCGSTLAHNSLYHQ